VNELPLTHKGRVGFQVDNILAAASAAFGLGHSFEMIRAGVISFAGDVATVPGRFNLIQHRDSTIILDYGHNVDALVALHDAISQMPHKRRKVVYTAAGDRRDEDIIRQAQLIGSFFEEIYVYEDQCTRGRADGEILRLMGQGFLRSRRARPVYQASGELAAIGAAIASLAPGDLLLCQVDRVELALEFVHELLQQRERAPHGPLAQFANSSAVALGVLSPRADAANAGSLIASKAGLLPH
jgi:cyanophycin synthetase